MIHDIRHTISEPRTQAGVTLVEMLIVVAIIGLLAAIAISIAAHINTQAEEQLTRSTFALLESALEEYHEYTGQFPRYGVGTGIVERSETLYDELNRIPASRKILESIDASLIDNRFGDGMLEIYDPWGVVLDYRYVQGENNFPVIISDGPDREPNTPDDISSR